MRSADLSWVRLPSIPRPDVLVTLAAALVAVEGVLALGGGLGLAVGQFVGRIDIDRQLDIAAPIVLAAGAGFLLQGSDALNHNRDERTLFQHTSIVVAAVAQLALAGPLVWLTVTDPVDARTNAIIVIVAIILAASAAIMMLAELPAPD